jgi:hypothetical protein
MQVDLTIGRITVIASGRKKSIVLARERLLMGTSETLSLVLLTADV